MQLYKHKRGFTLYELTIVLAIIAIVGTLVLSYVTFLSDYKDTVQEYNNASSEIYTFKVSVEKWFSHFDTSGYTFETDSSGNLTVKNTNYSVSYSNNNIYLRYETGSGYGTETDSGYNELILMANSINSLTFVNNGDDSLLWRCTVGCDSGNVIFLLERHVSSN